MGQPPAYLCVVRHGFRLDAADKQWHLSSPTPYDPPLTYSGWQQAKALGVRIASIIRERETAAERQTTDSSATRRRKRYKVVLHSSPFLRCIQTSIAISAGLAQDSTPFDSSPSDEILRPSTPVLSSRSRPTVVTDALELGSPPPKANRPVSIRKCVLRLDAFLGEWLSPTYFELITPPPGSAMMLASARADLLRREDYASYPNFSPHSHVHSNSQGSQGGRLWNPINRSDLLSASGAGSDILDPVSTSPGSTGSVELQSRRASLAQSTESSGYVSPTPHYAISNNNTIPPGYVAHARDACVDIDYQWDSTRGPLNWGDGGSFPEEWTSMHKRFRQGLQSLVDWYSTAENPTEMVTKTAASFTRRDSAEDDECAVEDEDEVDTESIVILVSHGAGCNALIGAITHQPVLTEVGMASLTMAVRKPAPEDGERVHFDSPKGSSASIVMHQRYELPIFASTDHLRSPAPTPTSSRHASIAGVFGGNRGRYSNSFSSSLSNFSLGDSAASRTSSANAALSGLRRVSNPPHASPRLNLGMNSRNDAGGITVGSGMTSFSATTLRLSQRPSVGLWSPTLIRDEEEDEDEDNMLPNFDFDTPSSKLSAATDTSATPVAISTPVSLEGLGIANTTTPPPELDSEGMEFQSAGACVPKGAALQGSSALQMPSPVSIDESPRSRSSSPRVGSSEHGLWGGGSRLPDEADSNRDLSSTKRRWTVTDRS
ncbi:hypothetical protein B0T22DRAFT_148991 [Podospora appendiculata]|uniref:Phosphoglycerate mutase n=1 Tax=Podospora appendiculata TaxID=314037 RepID=A0AAE1CC98_9PEZI|nr:hypothetical protein B0T22DRAFT_148991 [Podospora appendiculata]